MNSKLRVGLTMRLDSPSEYSEMRSALSQDWIELIRKLNFVAVPILNSLALNKALIKDLKIDALILTNGGESNVSLGGELNKNCDERDHTELQVFKFALQKKMPILGVCRGMQFIYRFYGGDIEKLENKTHVATENYIICKDKSTRLVGCYHELACSSLKVPSQLEIWAKSSDGVIEGLTHKSKQILGIQWHPERKHSSMQEDLLIIQNFLKK